MEIRLQVPLGYQYICKNQIVDQETAYNLLHSRFARRCTQAVRQGQQVQLVRHVRRCPYCGKEAPAYEPYIYPHIYQNNPVRRVHSALLWEWLGFQSSLWDDPQNILSLQQPDLGQQPFTCPKCGEVSQFTQQEASITVTCQEDQICLNRQIVHLGQLVQIPWTRALKGICNFPLTETLCFDFVKRNTQLILSDNSGAPLCSKVLHNPISEEKGGPIIRILKNKAVKRNLRRCFAARWQGAFPYRDWDLTLAYFMNMTLFPGYNASFYNTIPYDKKTGCIDPSFHEIAGKLGDPQKSLCLLKAYSLPDVKSLRRRFATMPGLLFYLEECRMLYQLLRDTNLLCRILDSKIVFSILSGLHDFPGLMKFYQDYCLKKGAITLCDHLEKQVNLVNTKAMEYAVSGAARRAAEQKRWSDRDYFFSEHSYHDPETRYSLPMGHKSLYLPNCTIGNYHFRRLCSGMDLEIAGAALNNCLIHWQPWQNPVTGVYLKGRIVAAIELEDNTVRQALGEHNHAISEHDPLYAAIEKWCKKYNLAYAI